MRKTRKIRKIRKFRKIRTKVQKIIYSTRLEILVNFKPGTASRITSFEMMQDRQSRLKQVVKS
jgi:hypothetical protein